MKPLTLAVQYCGGCNPQYDRVGLVTCFLEEFPQFTLQAPPVGEPDLTLVVAGCSRCRLLPRHPGLHGAVHLSSPEDYPALAAVASGILFHSGL